MLSYFDFQFVLGRGISPFFLDAKFSDFLCALSGWKTESEIYSDRVELSAAKENGSIDLVFCNDASTADVTFNDLMAVSSSSCVLSDGRSVSELYAEEFLRLLGYEIPQEVGYGGDGDFSVFSVNSGNLDVHTFEGHVSMIVLYK